MRKLADASSVHWEKLWTLVSELEDLQPQSLIENHGGNKTDDGFIVMPWTSYHPVVRHIEQALYALNVVQGVDWSQWGSEIDPSLVYDFERISAGSLYDTVCFITGIVRSERFGSGAIATSLLNGAFVRALGRLKVLTDT